MCRWLAYSGSPVLLEDLLYKPKHSLIDQSLHSTMGAETTNGDGFGVGWYGDHETPGTFHSVEPAWNDRNLRDLAAHVRSGLVFAHIRAIVRIARAADELPSVPPRPLALDAQRRSSPTSRASSASSCWRSTPSCIRRSKARPTRRSSSSSRSRSGSRTTRPAPSSAPSASSSRWARARRRASDPDDGGDERRHAPVGFPLLERREVAVALLLHARGHASRATPRSRRPARALRRVDGSSSPSR